MSLVLDCSAVLGWVLPDETTLELRAVFEQVARSGAVVPALWRLEVANALTVAIRRRRIDEVFRRGALADLGMLKIVTDQHTDRYAWAETLHLAEQHRLTVYDAAYLELAQRRSFPLATLDRELRAAALAAGVATMGAA